MIVVALEISEVGEAERHDEGKTDAWEPIASSQASTEESAKAGMLDNVLEALNDESLLPTNQWLRLAYYDDNKLTKVEVF